MLPQLKFWAETLVPPKAGWEIGWDAMILPINVLWKYFWSQIQNILQVNNILMKDTETVVLKRFKE